MISQQIKLETNNVGLMPRFRESLTVLDVGIISVTLVHESSSIPANRIH